MLWTRWLATLLCGWLLGLVSMVGWFFGWLLDLLVC
jgi:F0F1-type ATP synthase assembly protein I